MKTSRALVAVVLAALTAVMAIACTTDTQSPAEVPTRVAATATAVMAGPDGAEMGIVTLTEGPHGVLVSADVSGLSPGGHGFHIHEVGKCSPDFGEAGGHFDHDNSGHGLMHSVAHHAGDLPNIFAAADGTARADHFTDAVTLGSGPSSVFDADGSAIIIHAKPDSYGADPAAGDRVACGVISK